MCSLTELLQHLVALVQDKVLDVLQDQGLPADQGQRAARRPDHNVGAVLLQHLLVLLDGHAAEEHGRSHRGHVLGEALVLLADLEGQLPRVAHDQNGDLGGEPGQWTFPVVLAHAKLKNHSILLTICWILVARLSTNSNFRL